MGTKTYKTLDDEIFINGKKVYEIYENGTKVYPSSNGKASSDILDSHWFPDGEFAFGRRSSDGMSAPNSSIERYREERFMYSEEVSIMNVFWFIERPYSEAGDTWHCYGVAAADHPFQYLDNHNSSPTWKTVQLSYTYADKTAYFNSWGNSDWIKYEYEFKSGIFNTRPNGFIDSPYWSNAARQVAWTMLFGDIDGNGRKIIVSY